LLKHARLAPERSNASKAAKWTRRAYTFQCLGSALEFDFAEEDVAKEILWLTILHMSSMFCILIIPLLVWSWKKNQTYKINKQGRQVLNFQITMTLLLFTSVVLLILMPVSLTFLGTTREAIMGENPILIPLVLIIVLTLLIINNHIRTQVRKSVLLGR
jgi:uncharacterized Tic20 family protein